MLLSRNSAGQTKKSITYAVTCTYEPFFPLSPLNHEHH